MRDFNFFSVYSEKTNSLLSRILIIFVCVVLLGALVGGSVTEPEPGRYVAGVAPTPAHVASVTNWLASHNVLIGDLQAGRQQLESVFLKLTAEREPGNTPTHGGHGRSGRGGRAGRRRRA